MRKFDVEVLKDTLDAQYESANLILLEIIMMMLTLRYHLQPTTVSTYAYVNDSARYKSLQNQANKV
jgi:hypothetical protein